MDRNTLIGFCKSAKLRQEVIDSIPTVSAPVEPIVEPVLAPVPPVNVSSNGKSTKKAKKDKTAETPTPQPVESKKRSAAPTASAPTSEQDEPQRGKAKLAVLAAIRRLIPDNAKGEDAVTTSTLIAKHLRTTTTAVIRELERLGSSKLVKLEDDSPDPKNRLFYVSLTPTGKAYAIPAEMVPNAVTAPVSTPAPAPANPKPSSGKKVLPQSNPGPQSKFSGKHIYKLGEWKAGGNPRREGTHGWKSFSLIKDGMPYEDYRDGGGRNNDLQWDIDHGYVEVR
jgi:hypothetical protein